MQKSENLQDKMIRPSLHQQVHDCNNRKSRHDINTHFTMKDVRNVFTKFSWRKNKL